MAVDSRGIARLGQLRRKQSNAQFNGRPFSAGGRFSFGSAAAAPDTPVSASEGSPKRRGPAEGVGNQGIFSDRNT